MTPSGRPAEPEGQARLEPAARRYAGRLAGHSARQDAVEAFRGSGPSDEQSTAMLEASVAEYDVADVRSLT